MPKYMVERNLPGFDVSQLPGAAASAKEATETMTSEGTPIRYLRSTFVPAEQKCFCLFEGGSVDSVREAQDRAGLPYERIHEAEFITSEELA
ncbi:MAG: DUF4242 domain-containing protein [Actinobacteria bacterium]|nr:DUF4242 domain-containing protein [Actinomycetota bacterium]